MRKIIFLLLLTIFLLTGCGDDWNKKETLIIGLDDNYAPFGFRDDQGRLIGFDIDLANEVASRMGVKFEFKPIDWDNKREEITSGKVDMIWNGLDIVEERKEYMIFTKPYMDNRQILLVKQENDFNFYSKYDLAGKIVGTQAGSNSEQYVNEDKKLKDSLAEFKTYPNVKEEFAALIDGQCDVLIIDELAARYEMNRNPNKFKFIEVTVGEATEIGIGFDKNNVALRDKVQKVFGEMTADGTARKISLKWFDADLVKSHR